MKNQIIISVYLLLITINLQAQNQVVSIENKIETILLEPKTERVSKLNNLLTSIPNQLTDVDNSIKNYWKAYINYRIGICYLSSDKKQTSKSFGKALRILEEIEKTNSEILALEGTITSTQISLQNDKAWSLSQKASKKFKKSLEYDEKNPRAHLGLGKSDFYKPSEYGGGTMVDSYLKKALKYFKEQELKNNAPKWGEEEVYYFLSAYYRRKQSLKDAKFYNSLN